MNLLLSEISFDLNYELTKTIEQIIINGESEKILDKKILLFFTIPLKRFNSGNVEKTEYYAFITDVTLRSMGIMYGILGIEPDQNTGFILGPKPEIGDIETIKLYQAKIRYSLDSKLASLCNGVPYFTGTIVAIGVGALGSQIIKYPFNYP